MTTDVFAQAGKNIAVVLRAGVDSGEAALNQVGIAATKEIKLILSQSGRGETYRRRTVVHRASAPGDPPAVDTGHYRASWAWAVHKVGAGFELVIGTAAKIAVWLEYGTSRMAARPHLRVLAEKLRSSAGVSKTVGEFMVAFQQRATKRVPH